MPNGCLLAFVGNRCLTGGEQTKLVFVISKVEEPASAGVNLTACTGRKILWNLHRQDERSIKPNLNFKTQFCFLFRNERENLTGILTMPLETFGRFFQRTFSLIRFLDPRLMKLIESKFDFSFEIK